jgi:hypothetical protein
MSHVEFSLITNDYSLFQAIPYRTTAHCLQGGINRLPTRRHNAKLVHKAHHVENFPCFGNPAVHDAEYTYN